MDKLNRMYQWIRGHLAWILVAILLGLMAWGFIHFNLAAKMFSGGQQPGVVQESAQPKVEPCVMGNGSVGVKNSDGECVVQNNPVNDDETQLPGPLVKMITINWPFDVYVCKKNGQTGKCLENGDGGLIPDTRTPLDDYPRDDLVYIPWPENPDRNMVRKSGVFVRKTGMQMSLLKNRGGAEPEGTFVCDTDPGYFYKAINSKGGRQYPHLACDGYFHARNSSRKVYGFDPTQASSIHLKNPNKPIDMRNVPRGNGIRSQKCSNRHNCP